MGPDRTVAQQLRAVLVPVLTLSEPAFFWVSRELGGGLIYPPPPAISDWGIWEISAKHDFCDDFSGDYFEVHNISVVQNLSILEAILLKMSKNQATFLKSLFFDLQICVIPQKNPQKNPHWILK